MSSAIRSLRFLPASDSKDRQRYSDGEVFYDRQANTLRIYTGNTPGGFKLATEAFVLANSGLLSVTSNIVPATANTYTLGSAEKPWASLYVSTNTIYIGGTPVGVDSGGNLTVGEDATNLATEDYVNDQGFITTAALTWTNISSKPTFSTVATSGSYADLSDKPGPLIAIGFAQGVIINQFSNDNTMTANSAEAVPVQSAVRGYIDRRLGIDHDGIVVAEENKIGPRFATESYVTTAISNIDIPTVDFTGYATETYVTTQGYITSSSLTGLATETFVGTAISNLVDSSPTTLNTLNELAAALGDDPNFATTVATAIGEKEPSITAGTVSQYFRGDKTFQTLNAAAVGLGNVTNESKATMFSSPTFTGTIALGVQQLVFDRTVGDNWIGSSVVIENGNISVFEAPTGFNSWLNSLEPGDQFTIQPGGQELTVASTTINGDLFLITTEEIIDESPGASALPSGFWITSFTQNIPATISGVTKAMVGLGNVTNESKATMFSGPTFTGTVSGVTATHVGLGNVTNESKATMFSSPTFTGITTLQQSTEVLTQLSSATGIVAHNFGTGSIWYHSSISADFTANFTNVPATNNRSIVCTLILVQGATARIPAAVQIDGSAQTIKWLGSASAPAGNANKVDIVSFTLIRTGSTWAQVLGSLTTYG